MKVVTFTSQNQSNSRHLFAALLKHWRSRQGLSQLDLSLASGVSSKHISFLETGRTGPSKEMVAILCETLDIPLRSRVELYRAANLESPYPQTTIAAALDGPVRSAVEAILQHHEPYPSLVMNRLYELEKANLAGTKLIQQRQPGAVEGTNLIELLFTSDEPIVENWEQVAKSLIQRLRRESLQSPSDAELSNLVDRIITQHDLDESWLTTDFNVVSSPVVPITFLLTNGVPLRFISMVTVFDAPQNVALDELRIESFYPLDSETEEACEQYLTVSS